MAEELQKRDRVTLRLYPDEHEMLNYWAEKEGISVNELVMNAFEVYRSVKNGDYRTPSILENRLNQVVEHMAELTSEVHAMSSSITTQLETLTDLTRGDNYLYSEEERGGI